MPFFGKLKIERMVGEEVLNECVLDQSQVELLMGGLNYASVRDSIPKRKKAYRDLFKVLAIVLNERRE